MYYLKVASPKQNSLIIGDSRALQGLIPSIINSSIGNKDLYNFSFDLGVSPYGKVYFNAIKNKIKKEKKDGIFIVTIDPWGISSISKTPNDENTFIENELKLNKIKSFSINPNFGYIYKYIKTKTMISGVLKNYNLINYTMMLHDDGWLELFIPMDSIAVKNRIKHKINAYRKNSISYRYSSKRFEYLKKTIIFLKEHGNVYLVRLPVYSEMQIIENEFMPNFDSLVQDLSKNYEVPYVNFTRDSTKYKFIDGNHLYKESSKTLSIKLAKYICELNK